MPIVADAAIAIRGDLTQFKRDLAGAGTEVNTLGGRLKSVFSPRNLAIGGVIAGVAAVTTLAAGIGSAIGRLMEWEKIHAQTEATLKSTGGAANVSRKKIDDLAASIENISGIEAESITKGENLLLTFTNVKNEVGTGNDIFSRTTQIMTDMSVAMGTDVSQAALQLGKALNDPIRGVTNLARAGVAFTAQQRDQIKTLVESGHTLEAQKLILEALDAKFAGSAAAFGNTMAGKAAHFHNFIDDVFENITAGLGDAVKTAGDATNFMALNFGDMGTRIHRIADLSGKDFATVKASVQYNMTQMGMSFSDAADAADTQFGTITRSHQRLVAESGKAWDLYQSQIRVTNVEVASQMRHLSGTIMEQFDLWHTYVVDLSLRTPGDIANALRQGRDAVKSAAAQLAEDQADALAPAVERAQLIAILTGSELAAGLLSQDPIVRRDAQQLRDSIYARLGQLSDDAWLWGSNVGRSFGNGLISAQGYVNDKANQLKSGVQRFLEFAGSPAYTHSREIGMGVGQSWADGLVDSINRNRSYLGASLADVLSPGATSTPPEAVASSSAMATGMGATGGNTYILQVEGTTKTVESRNDLLRAYDTLSRIGDRGF